MITLDELAHSENCPCADCGIQDEKTRVSIERCREILGEEYKNLTEDEVIKIRNEMEMLANMAIKSFMSKKTIDKSK